MWKRIQRLFGGTSHPASSAANTSPQSNVDDPSPGVTIRFGKAVPIDEGFQAWTSGDLKRMLNALNIQTNLIDRHFLLMNIVEQTYKKRSDPQMAQTCAQIAELHLREFPQIAPVLREDFDGMLPRVATFQRYATLLAEGGEFDKAIDVCRLALTYGLDDNTQSGFQGRIHRIKKEKAKRQQA